MKGTTDPERRAAEVLVDAVEQMLTEQACSTGKVRATFRTVAMRHALVRWAV